MASRTLVKSPPELWAELSDQVSLAGHLAEPFGEIRITRLEPETAVAWEGERASGTVRIEPSGWGTRVTLTARAAQADEPPEEEAKTERPAPAPPPPEPEPLPAAAVTPPQPPVAAASPTAQESPPAVSEAPRRGLLGLLRGWRASKSARAAPEAGPPEPLPAADEPAPEAALDPAPQAAEPAPQATPDPAPEAPAALELAAAPESVPTLEIAPAPAVDPAVDPDAVLVAVLDRLGSAHHRPFSRS